MKIVDETLAYITPAEGQGVLDMAKEIAKSKKNNEIGEKIFINLPNGDRISIEGNTDEQIRDSIMTQWQGGPKF